MKALVIHGARDLRLEERPPQALTAGCVRMAIRYGGICGSDLHYFHDGGIGEMIRIREPLILGHEVEGRVIDCAFDVTGLKTGDRVAVSPSRPCGACRFCDAGIRNQCLNMRFYGSAMPMPHVQGAFRQSLVAHAWQCHLLDPGVPEGGGAFAEPLAVVLHGINRSGGVKGKRVLVTGCGPIGALCVAVARVKGAAEVVVTDIVDEVLEIAGKIGADRMVNVMRDPDWIADYAIERGSFDVMFEATGNQSALRDGLEVLQPRAVLIQLGLGGDLSIPQNVIVAKEIEMRGAFRFHEEFTEAVAMINADALPLAPLLTHVFSLNEFRNAFEIAGDRRQAMKVQIDFGP